MSECVISAGNRMRMFYTYFFNAPLSSQSGFGFCRPFSYVLDGYLIRWKNVSNGGLVDENTELYHFSLYGNYDMLEMQ